jgi:nucleoid DNA-binding protein
MNKLGLRKAVYVSLKKKMPKLTKPQIKEILDIVLDTMLESLVTTKRLSIRDFGAWEIKYMKAREGYSPIDNKRITIKERTKLKFKPASTLMNRIKI